MIFLICSVAIASKLAVGSSRKMMGGFLRNMRAMATRCCCPPERSVALEKELGIPYDFWMRLQYGYEHDCLVIARREVEEQQRTRREPSLLNKVASIL